MHLSHIMHRFLDTLCVLHILIVHRINRFLLGFTKLLHVDFNPKASLNCGFQPRVAWWSHTSLGIQAELEVLVLGCRALQFPSEFQALSGTVRILRCGLHLRNPVLDTKLAHAARFNASTDFHNGCEVQELLSRIALENCSWSRSELAEESE